MLLISGRVRRIARNGRSRSFLVALTATGSLALAACGGGEAASSPTETESAAAVDSSDEAGSADGDSGDVGSAVVVVDAWARQPAMGQTVAAAYVTLSNPGDTEVRLRGASSSIGRTELHQTEIGDDGVMSMQERLEGFVIPPGGELVMEPGGVHIMFVDIDREAFIAAGEVDVELDLGDDGVLEVTVPIAVDLDDEAAGDMHGDMHGDMTDGSHDEMHEQMHGSDETMSGVDESIGIAIDEATGLPDANVLHDLDDELNVGVYEPERQMAVVAGWRRALLAAEIPADFDLESLMVTLGRLEAALYRGDVEAAGALAFEAHDLAHGLIPH